jgi:predicted ATPase
LLTLSGPPGIGKTRLALEITSNLAQDFADGTYLVPLAPITESRLVLATIAQSVGIREAPGQPLSESLANYLRDRQVLLLLDNFEQVIEAATGVAELLSHCPDLKMLVTSRELLRIYGEYDYPVPPLTLPDTNKLPDLESLSHFDAVELFMQRAQAVSPAFVLTEQSAHAVASVSLGAGDDAVQWNPGDGVLHLASLLRCIRRVCNQAFVQACLAIPGTTT